MLYSQHNVLVSLLLDLATRLRGAGYDVLWQATGETEGNSIALDPAKAVITVTPAFPADPKYVVTAKADYPTGLNGDTPLVEQVIVPALSLTVDDRKQVALMGLGHTDRLWERKVDLVAFAHDEFQRRELMDLLNEWLTDEQDKAFPCYAHDVDPVAPSALDPVLLAFAHLAKVSYPHNEAVRFGITMTALVHYVE